jgi:hypothetical protein
MGVPELRIRFREIFGQDTASNNSAWLRKKLSEPPASEGTLVNLALSAKSSAC